MAAGSEGETEGRTSVAAAISRGLRCRCPRCGVGPMFSGFLTVAPRCAKCGVDFGFADAGDGPAVFVTLIVGTVVVGLVLILDIAYEPPIWVHLIISLPLAVVLCLAALRPSKGLLIALQYRNQAEQGRFG